MPEADEIPGLYPADYPPHRSEPPAVFRSLREDIEAVLENDAAANSYVETLVAHSPLHAIWTYRLAHLLTRLGVPVLPRLLSTVARLLTGSYVIAVDVGGGPLEAESVAYFYDHRNASGIIARDGGAVKLGRLDEVRTVVATDGALLIQSGSTINGWIHE